tara:strand:- start:6319 stop:6423 length:105 start_codon:yes stop_codon:yes gene_type:complete
VLKEEDPVEEAGDVGEESINPPNSVCAALIDILW